MIKRPIAFVLDPIVRGIFLVMLQHEIIAVGLCKDACCCDGKIFAITLDDGGVRNFFVRLEPVAINDDERWLFLQLVQ